MNKSLYRPPVCPSNQLTNRLTKRQDRHGAATIVEERIVGVDAEMTINRGPEIVWREWSFFGMFTFGIRGTNDLARADSAAGHDKGHRLWPVVAAGLLDSGL